MKESIKELLKKKNLFIINQRRIQSLENFQGNNLDESIKWSGYFRSVIFLCFSETKNFLYKKTNNHILISVPFKLTKNLFQTLLIYTKTFFNLIYISTKIVKRFKIDLLRPENTVLVGLPILLVGRLTKSPVVNWYIGHERNALLAKYRKNLLTIILTKIIFLFERIILNSANCVITLSDELLEIAQKHGVTNLIFSPNSLDPMQFPQRDYTHLKMNTPKIIILFSGRLDPEKNLVIILKSIKILSKDYKNIELHIAGDGVMREWIKSYIKNVDLEDIVKMYGYLDYSKMPDLYQQADIFLLPSKQIEGMSAALMEAMCTGCASIVTPIGHHKKLIIEDVTGKLVNEGDIIDLTDKIKFFLDNVEKIEVYGKNARKLVLKLSKNYYNIHGFVYKKVMEIMKKK